MDVFSITVEDTDLITSKSFFWWMQATDVQLIDKAFVAKKHLTVYYRQKSLPYFTNICYHFNTIILHVDERIFISKIIQRQEFVVNMNMTTIKKCLKHSCSSGR